MFIFLVKMVTA